MAESHSAFLVRHEDGRVTVESADPVIWVATELLEQVEEWALPAGPGGDLLQLDTDGEYIYRKVGPAPGDACGCLAFERVADA